ncbi:uncharacterized acetyltransferase At3g50280 [Fagus crenata]
MPCSSASVVSKCVVFPDQKSTLGELKLTVSDLPMLSVHYIQKGVLFTRPPIPIDSLIALLKRGLSQTLSHFPPLAGRLRTDSDGHVYITCNDAGAEFIHVTDNGVFIRDVLVPGNQTVKEFFAYDRPVSYSAHFNPILAVKVTELADGVFIGCTVCHAVTDGTSFWNFFNTFAEVCRGGVKRISKPPVFNRDSALLSPSVLELPEGGPQVTFNVNAPLRERIFSFTREAILKLKAKTNNKKTIVNGDVDSAVELMGKQSNDTYLKTWLSRNNNNDKKPVEISSFQSLSALLWRSVTRARKLPSNKTTTFKMAVNIRQRLEPKLDAYYFGNGIQSIVTIASAGDVLTRDPRWCAEQLNTNVLAHNDAIVRRFIGDWESNPRCFPLGNFDGATITMGSSPRFPMYDNDFGWGRPLAVRSGGANKFDGKISAFPGREGGGSVDLEVALAPDTMAALESDSEFMQYVSNY